MQNKEQRPKDWVDQAKTLNYDVEIGGGNAWSSKLISSPNMLTGSGLKFV